MAYADSRGSYWGRGITGSTSFRLSLQNSVSCLAPGAAALRPLGAEASPLEPVAQYFAVAGRPAAASVAAAAECPAAVFVAAAAVHLAAASVAAAVVHLAVASADAAAGCPAAVSVAAAVGRPAAASVAAAVVRLAAASAGCCWGPAAVSVAAAVGRPAAASVAAAVGRLLLLLLLLLLGVLLLLCCCCCCPAASVAAAVGRLLLLLLLLLLLSCCCLCCCCCCCCCSVAAAVAPAAASVAAAVAPVAASVAAAVAPAAASVAAAVGLLLLLLLLLPLGVLLPPLLLLLGVLLLFLLLLLLGVLLLSLLLLPLGVLLLPLLLLLDILLLLLRLPSWRDVFPPGCRGLRNIRLLPTLWFSTHHRLNPPYPPHIYDAYRCTRNRRTLAYLPDLGLRKRTTGILCQGRLLPVKRNRGWRRRGSRHYPPAHHAGRRTRRPGGSVRSRAENAGPLGRNGRSGDHLDCGQLSSRYRARVLVHAAPAGKGVLRNRRNAVLDPLVYVGDRRIIGISPAVIIVDGGGVDHRVGGIHPRKVTLAHLVRRKIRLAGTQGEPSYCRRSSDGKAQAKTGAASPSANPAHQRGRIDRGHAIGPGYPAPTAAKGSPTAVVIGSESPRCVVHPGPTPRSNPGPMPVMIGRPACSDCSRHPDLAVAGLSPPAAVLVQVFIAGDFARNVACGQGPVFAEVT